MWQRLFQYHPVIGWLKIPDKRYRLNFADGIFMYRTNSAGFRSTEAFDVAKPAGTARVLVFGDSFTEGACVDEGKRFSELLADRLDIQFYNFGLSGTGTDQQFLIYRELAAQYEHDLVLVTPWAENIRRNAAAARLHGDEDGGTFYTPKPYFRLEESGQLTLHNQPVPRPVPYEDVPSSSLEAVDPGTMSRRGLGGILATTVNRLGPGPKRMIQRALRRQPLPEYDDPDGSAWSLTRAIIEHWARESTTPMVVMPIPVYQHLERIAPSDAVRARFAELHQPPEIVVHDPLPDLWRYSADDRRAFRFPNDHHLTEAGHRAVADSLEPILRDLLPR